MRLPTSRPGNRLALLAALAAQLEENDLAQISRRDYMVDEDAHLAQLKCVAERLLIPDPLEWHPGEVLELTRWSEVAEGADHKAVFRVHRQRAFSCATLLAAMSAPDTVLDGGNYTLIQLIESLRQFRFPMDREASDLLIWLIHSDYNPHPSELALMGLGLLHFALVVPDWNDCVLSNLVDWIMQNEKDARNFKPGLQKHGESTWLLSTTPYDQLHHKWRQLGPALIERLSARHGQEVVDRVRRIADNLEKG